MTQETETNNEQVSKSGCGDVVNIFLRKCGHTVHLESIQAFLPFYPLPQKEKPQRKRLLVATTLMEKDNNERIKTTM